MNCPKCNQTINPFKGLIEKQIEYIKNSKSDLLMRCEKCNTEVSINKDKITDEIDMIPGKINLLIADKKFKLDLNLDAMGEAENFIDTYGTDKGRTLANQLGIKGKGSSLLATGLSNYAWNTHTAQKCRLKGRLDTALMYESIADRIYKEDIQPVCNCW